MIHCQVVFSHSQVVLLQCQVDLLHSQAATTISCQLFPFISRFPAFLQKFRRYFKLSGILVKYHRYFTTYLFFCKLLTVVYNFPVLL